MTTLREAAQQALEALEADCCGGCDAEYNPCRQRRLAESLRAALAQKQAEPLNLRDPAVQKRLATQWGYVPAAAQAEPDHETRAELAEQQVVQLAEERDHYRNLWQKAQQDEPHATAAELRRLRHNNQVLTDALWKACGDDEEAVNSTIASQGELK